MSRKQIPKGSVQRKVMLNHEALTWALCVLKDERHNVTVRAQMTPDWEKKYASTEKQLVELIAAAERG